MIGGYHNLGRRPVIPTSNEDPFFVTRYGLSLARPYVQTPTVAPGGFSQSACGGTCAIAPVSPPAPTDVPTVTRSRPAVVRAIQAVGRVLANI